jgi:nicotinate-nucleotide adenylyltransferase
MQKKYNEDIKGGQALFGGSFDPIHCGHMAIAQSVLSLEMIDEVIFIPNAVSPLKFHNPLASNAQRREMVLEAIQGIEGFSLDDREMKSGGISYTIDTIEQYRKGTESELYFIIGADQFHQLYNWHRVDDLIEELKFLVYPRKGYALDEAPILSSKVINYEVLNLPYWDMSSTKIRKLCERSESIEAFVPRNVEAYIKQNQIYQSS